jgi:hypothetical protein
MHAITDQAVTSNQSLPQRGASLLEFPGYLRLGAAAGKVPWPRCAVKGLRPFNPAVDVL